MLDINIIRETPDVVRKSLSDRQMDPSPVDAILQLDEKRRTLLSQVEVLKAERNTVSKEIGQMKGWREQWFAGKPAAMNMEMPGMMESMKMDMAKLTNAKDKDFDLAFIDMMTPHHVGAVTMAKEALQKSEKPEIKTLAGQIIKAQEAEIKMMGEWKAKWSK